MARQAVPPSSAFRHFYGDENLAGDVNIAEYTTVHASLLIILLDKRISPSKMAKFSILQYNEAFVGFRLPNFLRPTHFGLKNQSQPPIQP